MMSSIKNRLSALEGRFTGKPVCIFAYGDAGLDMVGYRTLGGEEVVRQKHEAIEELTSRAVKIEARQHPELKTVVLHELYSAEYWQDSKPCWLAELFAEDAIEI